jgi:archaemetzincin
MGLAGVGGLILIPVGGIGPGELFEAKQLIQQAFKRKLEIHVSTSRINPPMHHIEWDRLQYRADHVARWIADMTPTIRKAGYLVIGVCGCDAYVEGLNFVFGLAIPAIGVATVYTRRLVSRDREQYIERIAKEVVHETGHLLGLQHCNDRRCVMSFSNSVLDVDRKSYTFCDNCWRKIEGRLNVDNKG